MQTSKDPLKNYFQMKYDLYIGKKRRERFFKKLESGILFDSYREIEVVNESVIEESVFKYLPYSKKIYFTYLNAIGTIAVCTLICFILHPHLRDSNLIMVYLLGVTIVALMGKMGPAILASVLSVLAYDFFFIPPVVSFSVSDIQYFFTLMVMLIVAQTISYLTIHARHQMDATRKAQTETENERFRNIFLTSVSHDLRTPLTAIMGSASSLLQPGKKLTEEMHHELVQNIYDESERLNQLINNILKIIRIESGSVRLEKQAYAFDEIITLALNKLNQKLDKRPVTIHLPTISPLIELDHILMEQVFINIIENAIKFTPDNSPIEISVEFNIQNALVKIADRGPGIPPEEIDKIFDKFHRGQKPEITGMGLGLAISKGIILAHKGKIWAEPRQNGGTIFCFTLPR